MNKTFTHRIIFKGYNVEDELIDEKKAKVLNAKRNSSPKASFTLRGNSYGIEDIKAIVALDSPRQPTTWLTCANLNCDSGKHPSNMRCPYSVGGSCQDCDKELLQKDIDYQRARGRRILCRECLYGAPPVSERYDLNDPKQAEQARETSFAEGLQLGKDSLVEIPLCKAGKEHFWNRMNKCRWCGKEIKQEALV